MGGREKVKLRNNKFSLKSGHTLCSKRKNMSEVDLILIATNNGDQIKQTGYKRKETSNTNDTLHPTLPSEHHKPQNPH